MSRRPVIHPFLVSLRADGSVDIGAGAHRPTRKARHFTAPTITAAFRLAAIQAGWKFGLVLEPVPFEVVS